MRHASRLILALPAAAVALDTALYHVPCYVVAALLALCLFVLARRCWDWCRTVLLFVLACMVLTDAEKGEPQPEQRYENA